MISGRDIAKALLKVGLKAAVPVLGDVVSAAVEEVGGLVLEPSAARRSARFQERLITDISSNVESACYKDGISEDQMNVILSTVQDALARYPLSVPEWTDVRFDSSEAAAKVL